MAKRRLDEILVERELVRSRSQARAMIMASQVLVSDVPVTKAGTLVAEDAAIRLRDVSRYVSRGGQKLEGALKNFNIDVTGLTALDVGASTGGFTDCLLQHGVKKVFALDVGKDQLDWKIRTDARVVVMDGINFRSFDANSLPEKIDICVMDASFISATLLLPNIKSVLSLNPNSSRIIALVKPQFEVGRENIAKGGIVRDEKVREESLERVINCVMDLGFSEVQTGVSPITGMDGNVEFLLTAILKKNA